MNTNDFLALFVLVIIFIAAIVFFVSLAWISSKTKPIDDYKEPGRKAKDKEGDGLLTQELDTDDGTVYYIIGDLVVKGEVYQNKFYGEIYQGGEKWNTSKNQ